MQTPNSLTCRSRHVKCDETKPRCKACVRIQSECSWPVPDPRHDTTIKVPRETANSSKVYHPVTVNPGGETDIELQNTLNHGPHSLLNASRSLIHGAEPTELSRLEAADQAAATLVGIRDGYQQASPALSQQPSESTSDGRRHVVELTQQCSPDSATHAHSVGSTPSLATSTQIISTSPGFSSLAANVDEWARSEAGLACGLEDFGVDDATHVWANLLLKDASSRRVSGTDVSFTIERPMLRDEGRNSVFLLSPSSAPSAPTSVPLAAASPSENHSFMQTAPAYSDAPDSELRLLPEGEPWQSPTPLELKPHEYPLFHDFIQNLSLWVRDTIV
jgi:hypothetical protein